MSKLIVKYNDEIIEEVALKQGDMTIGRRPGCDIVIDNLAVSGNHATIFTVGDDSFIQDLDSTNGTTINNKRISKHHLKHGDVVTIGKHSLIYVSAKMEKPVDEFEKTVVLSAGRPVSKPEERSAAIFILSGANSGKRIDLTKSVTNLGRAGKPAGVINRSGERYMLTTAKGSNEVPKLNGKAVAAAGEQLKHGDIIEVGDARLQFNLK